MDRRSQRMRLSEQSVVRVGQSATRLHMPFRGVANQAAVVDCHDSIVFGWRYPERHFHIIHSKLGLPRGV